MKELMSGLSVSETKMRVYNGQWADERKEDGTFMVRLRGLPWEATEENVKEFLKKANIAAEDIFIGSQKGRATGEAFAQFASEDNRNGAVSLRPTHRKPVHRNVRKFTQRERGSRVQSWQANSFDRG